MGNLFCATCAADTEDDNVRGGDHRAPHTAPPASPTFSASALGGAEEAQPGGMAQKHNRSYGPTSFRLLTADADHDDADCSSVESSPLYPQTPPTMFLNNRSLLMAPVQLLEIRRALPQSLRYCAWHKVFSLDEDPASLPLLHKRISEQTAVMFVALVNDGSLLGSVAVCPKGWPQPGMESASSFGSSETFLFCLPPLDSRSRNLHLASQPRHCSTTTSATGLQARRRRLSHTDSVRSLNPLSGFFHATGIDSQFVSISPDLVAFGSGKDTHGLWFDGDLSCAGTGPCPTFGIVRSLSKTGRLFDVLGLEVWCFSTSSTTPKPPVADGSPLACIPEADQLGKVGESW